MIIALDFDKTYTEDPEMWDIFVRAARKRGHTVLICTLRFSGRDNEDVDAAAARLGVPVVYCEGKPPKIAAAAMAGFFVDVWIDDMPHLCSSDEHYLIQGKP